ncbi:MAG: chemotaxis response regulator protein-glutamate methylesterase [Nitrospirae bacterium]|nr:chemotaxis response regulator protein-glutamate methylesterase [Nitrospirota bacterium]
MKKIRVLTVDDSALMRQVLAALLAKDPDIEVIGAAPDPYIAREKIKALNPDVLTLDVEMPKMDGLTFLEKLMRGRPMPVVMVSSLTEAGCQTTLRALELGAVDFITKPKIGLREGMEDIAQDLIAKVKAAAMAQVSRLGGGSKGEHHAQSDARPPVTSLTAMIKTTDRIMFTKTWAGRLNSLCRISVKEAQDGDSVLPGHALVAPGGYHMTLERSGARYTVRINQDPPVNRHRPSVDVTFASVARYAGANAVGVILTGMGDDGAKEMLTMKQAGAFTIAQDEATCVVFGMPKEAIKAGAVDKVLPLGDIAGAILTHVSR